ncbi:ArsC/Spx/MgsR family protein [Telmatospirillum sp.]|uniref:ArsC/Spx/MgsR family protein n=1 Tax=Telmatospirillum sp. TaxID=2079197 RepID=UPI002841D5D4|nr:ArsC/Spx/MgsR family protein [Telmatospirillum sp.]MDR3436170.1 ArsC/Spx/MgsR family protein [Telmatospirillum sp.]
MVTVLFYEKPGCRNNTRQKALLRASGHQVVARDLLSERWTAERLRPFFETQAVSAWFNPAAPRIKTGTVVPDNFDERQALAAMIDDPLLIRRPLIEIDGRRMAGFDEARLKDWIGLADDGDSPGEGCLRTDAKTCSPQQ